ncbi:MAG: type II toxin-antitoxin system HicA family toxin [Nitrosospira multiformis]|nr:type II toxin-antitoxin system HicA family toxin [Nitrosospira multiformis]
MKLPRDLTGKELIKALEQMGYHVTRQTGSHVRMSYEAIDQHHVTVPLHNPLRIGTLAAILADVASYHKLTREELVSKLLRKN